MKNYHIVDANSLGYFYNNSRPLTVGDQQVQAVFGVLKRVRELQLKAKAHNAELLFLWDGHAQWRYDLLPKYKADRDKNPKQALSRNRYKSQKPIIKEMLNFLGISQCESTAHEADDLAGYFCKKLKSEILLISGDKDWLQLVDKNVSILNIHDDSTYSLANFFETTGYDSGVGFLQGKALMGDASDKIPPVGGIGKGTAPLFIAEFGSVPNFLHLVDSGDYIPTKKAHIDLASKEGRKKFAINIKLMSLRHVKAPTKNELSFNKGEFNERAFKEFCEKWVFNSILVQFDKFIEPFYEV